MLTLLIALSVVAAMLVFAVSGARQNAPVAVTWRPCGKKLTRSIVDRTLRGDLSAQQLWDQARVFDSMERRQDGNHLRDLVMVAQLRDRIDREERQQAEARRIRAYVRVVTA